MESFDLILDSNNDLSIKDGDFEIAQSDDQNIESILLAEKGQFYEFPLLGYGIKRRLNGSFNKLKEKKDIRESLRRDNYNTTTLIIESNPDGFNVTVDAIKIK